MEAPSEEPIVAPVPPRHWWLKRIVAGATLLLVALIGLRLWWGWYADRALQTEINKYIAAGEPIYPEDFDSKETIPDEDNAAKMLQDAEAAINLTPDQSAWLGQRPFAVSMVSRDLQITRTVLESNAEVYRLVRRARDLPMADWGIRLRTPAINFLMPTLAGQRQVTRLLRVRGLYHHSIHDDDEALESLRDILAQSRTIAQQPSLIAQLTAIAGDGVLIMTIEEILPSIKVQRGEVASADRERGADRQTVKRLIADLLLERDARLGLSRSMLSERMSQLDIMQQLQQGKTTLGTMMGPGPAVGFSMIDWASDLATRPLLDLETLVMLHDSTVFAEAALKPNWAEAYWAAHLKPSDGSFVDDMTHFISRAMTPSVERALLLRFRSSAQRRMGATALAIRFYEVEHGTQVEALSPLVPEYLDFIPFDPFAADDRPISYRPESAPRILYSVGSDGVDDGGAYAMRRGGSIDLDQLDLPFFLDGDRPRPKKNEDPSPAPSTQTVDDDQNIENDSGDADEDEPGEQEP